MSSTSSSVSVSSLRPGHKHSRDDSRHTGREHQTAFGFLVDRKPIVDNFEVWVIEPRVDEARSPVERRRAASGHVEPGKGRNVTVTTPSCLVVRVYRVLTAFLRRSVAFHIATYRFWLWLAYQRHAFFSVSLSQK
jgi:hypothetical protein